MNGFYRKLLLEFEPMTSVLPKQYSTTKWKALYGWNRTTYALPWHYSTIELKGLFIPKLATFIYYTIMGLLHNVRQDCSTEEDRGGQKIWVSARGPVWFLAQVVLGNFDRQLNVLNEDSLQN